MCVLSDTPFNEVKESSRGNDRRCAKQWDQQVTKAKTYLQLFAIINKSFKAQKQSPLKPHTTLHVRANDRMNKTLTSLFLVNGFDGSSSCDRSGQKQKEKQACTHEKTNIA